jgi:hypothetical protein
MICTTRTDEKFLSGHYVGFLADYIGNFTCVMLKPVLLKERTVLVEHSCHISVTEVGTPTQMGRPCSLDFP